MNLETLLHQTFGHTAFRANQEAVCRAATDGRDVLLVMPTGAGKSLCYQLPALARGGTALVISPLIALMDDQAAKLSAVGLKVARIHSGLSREDSRQACRDYLDGNLQFLFIAPERMRVPGFPEMLAKRKPGLIAIDEAHCISAWGHDFRPDYRTLGDYLPSLRPAPVIALTATATPTVQKDIVAQLQLQQPKLFIHGFRRDNLHIEVVEMSKPRRNEFTVKLLSQPENRPAIVYAPSRKSAEELASLLGGKAAAYHAGLEPSVRERIQTHFLGGKLEVVVATIAFGMGIDKADVRTVIHIALPGSVEAYYQEIGRAGRDGEPSRTVLLHSFADRKMHDFFLERDYPAATELVRVAALLTPEYQMPSILRQRLRMDEETFNRAVEKLASQGAAAIDFDGLVRATENTHASKSWRSGYDLQLAFRRSQIDRIVAYAESPQCRMTALIQHFGDTADGLRPCGHCDFCSPEHATAQPFRTPTQQEDRQLRHILGALENGQPRATGKLHTDLALGIDRKQFDVYLDALTRAGLITLTPDTFTNPEGREITFKRAALTHEGRTRDEGDDLGVLIRETDSSPATKKSSSRLKSRHSERSGEQFTPAQKELEVRLREWRKAEAAKTGKPAFIVFGDAVLHNLVAATPRTIAELLTVSGIGPEKADRYGAPLIALCRGTDTGSESAPKMGFESAAKSSQPRRNPDISISKATPKASRATPEAKSEMKQDMTSAKAAASRLPKASALGLSTSNRNGASAPGVISSRSEIVRPGLPETEPSLTPDQQALDQRLRDWRKSESERLGLPQFFVFGSSALRAIVLKHPRTLPELRSLATLDHEKLERFGSGILAVCNT